MSVCGKALEFWNYQVQVAFDYERADLGQAQVKMAQLENAYGEKLEESYSKMNSLKRQLDAVLREAENYKQQIVELEEKYTEKARYDKLNLYRILFYQLFIVILSNIYRQKRKLEELYDSLKAKYEHTGAGGAIGHSLPRSHLGTQHFAVTEEMPAAKQRFSRLSPGPSRITSPQVPAPSKIAEDRGKLLYRASEARCSDMCGAKLKAAYPD